MMNALVSHKQMVIAKKRKIREHELNFFLHNTKFGFY